MDPIPSIRELGRGDRLVVEFDQNGCLVCPSWILEFAKGDAIKVRIRTAGKRVVPTEETVPMAGEDAAHIDELLRSLEPTPSVMKTSSSFKVSLQREDAVVATWAFEGVHPGERGHRGYDVISKMCESVRHEYRDPTVGELIKEIPSVVFLGLAFGVATIVGLIAWPFRRLFRLVRSQGR